MRVLITGNAGYVGPVLAKHFKREHPDWSLVGFDAGFFAHSLTAAARLPELLYDAQIWRDVREVQVEDLQAIDAVVHLAAVSNDPMGRRFEQVTEEINQEASLNLARKAREAGVTRFVFASSCSMYGASEGGARTETDTLNPLTAYARSKVGTEVGLGSLADDGFVVTSLRFSTACGDSDRLRLDLVLNDFVFSALTTGVVKVLSDGTPWRPLVDVADMARAIDWACTRDRDNGGGYVAVNVGKENYQVRDLANAVADVVGGSEVSINAQAAKDLRSYAVDFSLFQSLAPNHQPQTDLDRSIAELGERIRRLRVDPGAAMSDFVRLKVLEGHIGARRLDEALRWVV